MTRTRGDLTMAEVSREGDEQFAGQRDDIAPDYLSEPYDEGDPAPPDSTTMCAVVPLSAIFPASTQTMPRHPRSPRSAMAAVDHPGDDAAGDVLGQPVAIARHDVAL